MHNIPTIEQLFANSIFGDAVGMWAAAISLVSTDSNDKPLEPVKIIIAKLQGYSCD